MIKYACPIYEYFKVQDSTRVYGICRCGQYGGYYDYISWATKKWSMQKGQLMFGSNGVQPISFDEAMEMVEEFR